MEKGITKKKKELGNMAERIDIKVAISLIMLVTFGLVMVFSASAYSSANDKKMNYDALYLVKRQGGFALAGFAAIFAVRLFHYKWLEKLWILYYLLAMGLILALLSPLGVEANHATRWLDLGITFQVAEMVKILLILFLAAVVDQAAMHLDSLKILFFIWIAGGILALLLYKISNDLSSALVLLGITFGMTLIYCQQVFLHILIGMGALITVLVYRYNFAQHLPTPEALDGMSFRVGRIAAWIDPELYASDQGYQTLQALYAIGSGGLFGKGIGKGVQKLTKIPEAQNDMIFSVVCEELGVVGAIMLLYLFGYLVYQLTRIALTCKNRFGAALVTGIALQIIIQVAINVGVCLNVIPNTGISLPFISYGGTSLLLLMGEVGIVFSVFYQMDHPAKQRKSKQRQSNRKTNRSRSLPQKSESRKQRIGKKLER